MSTAELRDRMGRASDLRIEAKKAHGRRDYEARDAHLRRAAELYTSLGLTGMSRYCLKFIGH